MGFFGDKRQPDYYAEQGQSGSGYYAPQQPQMGHVHDGKHDHYHQHPQHTAQHPQHTGGSYYQPQPQPGMVYVQQPERRHNDGGGGTACCACLAGCCAATFCCCPCWIC